MSRGVYYGELETISPCINCLIHVVMYVDSKEGKQLLNNCEIVVRIYVYIKAIMIYTQHTY